MERWNDEKNTHHHRAPPPYPLSIIPSFHHSFPRFPAQKLDYVVPVSNESKVTIALSVNGEPAEVAFMPHKTLLEVLREDMGLTGTKHGCELGECGTCTVLLDGTPVLSCLVLGLACAGHAVRTVEGMAQGGKLHPLQERFADLGAAQPGYYTPAFLPCCTASCCPAPSRTHASRRSIQPRRNDWTVCRLFSRVGICRSRSGFCPSPRTSTRYVSTRFALSAIQSRQTPRRARRRRR